LLRSHFRYGPVTWEPVTLTRRSAWNSATPEIRPRRRAWSNQLNALAAAGTPSQRIYAENKTDATVDRQGLAALLGYTRGSDTIVVHTLDRLDRTSARSSTSCMHEAPSGVSGCGRGLLR
jgi:DNA invertase Pin-like site-specific DNA recombinase